MSRITPIVRWSEYEIDSDTNSGGELYLSLYSEDGTDPIAILVLSPTEVRDLITALEAELPFLSPPEETPEREYTNHMQDNL